ncbi:deoxynucleoside kinase [Ornithinimicrobium sediminis]|uniref:deoxynucleoside kinase n=1 Tax=Ornithinimicrobium sediminis TaxID=2904603 RepID=UPI001E2976E0|nr:deoxynucleoside kinase [Ornithinimicrobium sediminis]MCE0485870.1 deoxynucleoside kinase [Ornithinimicrobium sediminis]
MGSIGSGKTTLARILGRALKLPVLLESPEDNPFLARMKHDAARWCFPNQLWFLSEAYSTSAKLNEHGGVMDHSVEEVALVHSPEFAKLGWLKDEDSSLLDQVHHRMMATIVAPDLFVVLSTPPSVLIDRVRERSRPGDSIPTTEYLSAVSQRRESVLGRIPLPACYVDSHALDFRTGQGRAQVVKLVEEAMERNREGAC